MRGRASQRAGARRGAWWLALWLVLGLAAARAAETLPELEPDSVWVAAELPLRGQRQLSTLRVRRLLGSGLLSRQELGRRLDSLATLYAEQGLPLAELRPLGHKEGRLFRLDSLLIQEGPRLVMGRLELDPPLAGAPDPAQDLPPDRLLDQGRLVEGLRAWLARLDAQGRPLSTLIVDEFSLRPVVGHEPGERLALYLRGHVVDADTVRPGRLVVLEAGLTRRETYERLARLPEGGAWDPRRVADARRRLLATGWFASLEGPALGRTPQGLAWWVLGKELPAYRFDGLLGWLPGRQGESGRLAYHLDLTLANLAGTGRELHVLASRPEGWSQELKLDYREPFVFRWPLDAGLHLRQRVQDSTWVELELGLETGWEPLPGWRLELGVGLQELAPDSLNGYLLAGVDASQARRVGLILKADQRDDPRNPRRGWQARLEESWIGRELSSLQGLPPRGRDTRLRRQRMQGWAWLPLGRSQVLAVSAGAGRFHGQAPGVEDEFRLGGQEGPRGWREESIRTREWGLGQLEWRFLLGPAARTALFWDGLFWSDSAGAGQVAQGRGVALVLPVRQGQLDLQYALQPGVRWREGLLHVRVVTRF